MVPHAHEGTDLMHLRILPIIVLFALSATVVADAEPPTATLKGHTGTLSCLTFSRDGKLLASSAKDGTVIVWDFGARKPVVSIPSHKDMIVAVAFSPDGKTVGLWTKTDAQTSFDNFRVKELK